MITFRYFAGNACHDPASGKMRSGYGRENGSEGMRCFVQTKSGWLATLPNQPEPYARGGRR